jgi:hypothetical protein
VAVRKWQRECLSRRRHGDCDGAFTWVWQPNDSGGQKTTTPVTLAADYAAVEARTGHLFRQDLSMADIITTAQTAPATTAVANWAA